MGVQLTREQVWQSKVYTGPMPSVYQPEDDNFIVGCVERSNTGK